MAPSPTLTKADVENAVKQSIPKDTDTQYQLQLYDEPARPLIETEELTPPQVFIPELIQ